MCESGLLKWVKFPLLYKLDAERGMRKLIVGTFKCLWPYSSESQFVLYSLNVFFLQVWRFRMDSMNEVHNRNSKFFSASLICFSERCSYLPPFPSLTLNLILILIFFQIPSYMYPSMHTLHSSGYIDIHTFCNRFEKFQEIFSHLTFIALLV